MLDQNKLFKQTDLGNSVLIFELCQILKKHGAYNESKLREHCLQKKADYARTFLGILDLLYYVEFIKLTKYESLDDIADDKNIISLKRKYKPISDTEEDFTKIIIFTLCEKLSKDGLIKNYLNDDYMEVSEEKICYININCKYTSIRNLFIQSKIFKRDLDIAYKFNVTDTYHNWFKEKIIPLIDNPAYQKVPLSKLKLDLLLKEKYGEEAEQWVLQWENKRLNKHPKKDDIKIISEDDTAAGYDIKSYDNEQSTMLNRFIEVKSYSSKSHKNQPYFYWSKNEIKKSEEYKDKYFLYLIDRDYMHVDGYEPIIYSNPFLEIKNSKDWEEVCQSFRFSKIK
jgi:hypothetical protein